MLTCADCKAIDCANVGLDTNACDNFDGGGVIIDEETQDITPASRHELNALKDTVIGMWDAHLELERRVNSIIAAIVRASGAEEER